MQTHRARIALDTLPSLSERPCRLPFMATWRLQCHALSRWPVFVLDLVAQAPLSVSEWIPITLQKSVGPCCRRSSHEQAYPCKAGWVRPSDDNDTDWAVVLHSLRSLVGQILGRPTLGRGSCGSWRSAAACSRLQRLRMVCQSAEPTYIFENMNR